MNPAVQFDGIDDAPGRIRLLLEERGLTPKKRWGQNFMVSRTARERIVDELGPQPDDVVWEIGPGIGAITAILLERAARVVVFEVDHGMIRLLEDRFGDRIEVVAGDAVRTMPVRSDTPTRIVGNLPYRSAAAIITTILEDSRLPAQAARLVFTVQREMALRMVAGPGSADYSPFSVLCRITAEPRIAGDLSRGNFYPAPDVVSSIVTLEPRPVDPRVRRYCSICARSLFAQRRKTIGNTARILASALGRDPDAVRALIESCGISLAARAEVIPVGDYLRLGSALADEERYSGFT